MRTIRIYMARQAYPYGTAAIAITRIFVFFPIRGDKKALSVGLPAQGITTVMHQNKQHRYIHHLIYASPVRKNEIEVIEDIVAVYGVNVELKLQCVPKRVYLAPESIDLQYTCEGGVLRYTVPEINCHQMVVVDY